MDREPPVRAVRLLANVNVKREDMFAFADFTAFHVFAKRLRTLGARSNKRTNETESSWKMLANVGMRKK